MFALLLLLAFGAIVTCPSLCTADCPQAAQALANVTVCNNYTTIVLQYDPTVNSQTTFDAAVRYVCGNAACLSLVRAWGSACTPSGGTQHAISTFGCTVNGGQYCWSLLTGGIFPEINRCNSSTVHSNTGCPDDCRTAFRNTVNAAGCCMREYSESSQSVSNVTNLFYSQCGISQPSLCGGVAATAAISVYMMVVLLVIQQLLH